MGRALILFAGGADGWGVGLKRAGHTIVALAESDPDRRAALRHHHPDAVIYDDVRTVTRARLLADLGFLPDIVVGSPPCQDISCANNGRALGVDGPRSGLYFEFVRVVGEVRPDWYAAENAAQLKTRGYERIHAALDLVDYTCWPQVVGAREAGYFHLRKRSWLAGVHVSDAQGEPLGAARQPWAGASDDRAPADDHGAPRASEPAPGWTDGRGVAAYSDQSQSQDGSLDAGQGRAGGQQSEAHAGSGRGGQQGDVADSGGDVELQPQGPVGEVGRRAWHGGVRGSAPNASEPVGRSRPARGRRQQGEKGAEPALPLGLAAIERAARALGLGGRSRLVDHYRMAHGLRPGLARVCVSAYGDALVPDIAEAFGLTMPQLVAELRAARAAA